jgi:hypothetical protein
MLNSPLVAQLYQQAFYMKYVIPGVAKFTTDSMGCDASFLKLASLGLLILQVFHTTLEFLLHHRLQLAEIASSIQ